MTTLAHTPLIHIARWTETQRAQALATARQLQSDLLQQVKAADDRGDTAHALQLAQQYLTERRAYNTLQSIRFNKTA